MPKGNAARLRPSEVFSVPIQRSGTGCNETSALVLPGKLPYRQEVWLVEGWKALNRFENRSIHFRCPECRAKGVASSQFTEKVA